MAEKKEGPSQFSNTKVFGLWLLDQIGLEMLLNTVNLSLYHLNHLLKDEGMFKPVRSY